MEKPWIIAAIIIGAFVSVHSLQCYTCINCAANELTDSHLVTCGATGETGTGGNGTGETGTGGSGTNETSTGGSGTNETSTGGSGTNETSTGGSGTNETSTGGGGTGETGTGGSGTNEISTGETGTGDTGTGTGSVGAQFQALRVRRNVPSRLLDAECTCYGIKCDCDNPAAVLKVSQYADVTYVCAKGTIKGQNNTDVIIRGCTEATVCSSTLAQSQNVTDCQTCTEDKCNGAYQMQHSMPALLFIIASLYILNKN